MLLIPGCITFQPIIGSYTEVQSESGSKGPLYGTYNKITGEGTGITYGLRLENTNSGSGNDYGIYSTGEDDNYLSGNLGLGVDQPSEKLHFKASSDYKIRFEYDNEETFHLSHGNSGLFIQKDNTALAAATQDSRLDNI